MFYCLFCLLNVYWQVVWELRYAPFPVPFYFSLFMIRNLFSSVRTLGGLAFSAVLLLGYVYYSYQMPSLTALRPVSPTLEAAMNEVCQDVPGQLPEPERALRPTLLLPLAGDREELFTNRLRDSLDKQGWYRSVQTNQLGKVFDTVRELAGVGSDPSVRSMQWTPAELAGMMRSANAETVLRGSVDRLTLPDSGPVEIKLRLELWELAEPEAVLKCSFNVERPQPSSPADPQTSFWNRLRPYGVVLLIALVFPFAMIPWMQWAIREDSNVANLKALLGMTAIPLLAFLVFLFWQGKGGLDIALQGGIAALFLFFYTACILNFIHNKIK